MGQPTTQALGRPFSCRAVTLPMRRNARSATAAGRGWRSSRPPRARRAGCPDPPADSRPQRRYGVLRFLAVCLERLAGIRAHRRAWAQPYASTGFHRPARRPAAVSSTWLSPRNTHSAISRHGERRGFAKRPALEVHDLIGADHQRLRDASCDRQRFLLASAMAKSAAARLKAPPSASPHLRPGACFGRQVRHSAGARSAWRLPRPI